MNTANLTPAMQMVIDYLIEHGEITEFDRTVMRAWKPISALIDRGICQESEIGGSWIFSDEAAAHFNKPTNDKSAATDTAPELLALPAEHVPSPEMLAALEAEITPPMTHEQVDGIDMFHFLPGLDGINLLGIPPGAIGETWKSGENQGER